MKVNIVSILSTLIVMLIVFSHIRAYPAVEELSEPDFEKMGSQLKEHRRFRRFTCDVLKSELACKNHCFWLGKPGGYCRNGTCYCKQ
ncbi:defensin-like [Lycorma delicatula]|uniref:defensin-like n=1 Tax=Lycorma delicatula TaxID=130591 RepID=UPI003F50E202